MALLSESMACAGTPRMAEHVVKPARSSMNTTTTKRVGKQLCEKHNPIRQLAKDVD